MTTCGSCGARLQPSDRFCPACDTPNLGGPHTPKFRPRVTDLPPVEERPRRLHRGGPACPRCGEDDVPPRAAYCPSCGMDLAGARRAAAFSRDSVTGVWTSPGPHNLDPYRPLRHLTSILVAGLVLVIGLVVAWSVAQLVLYAKLEPRLPGLPLDAVAARTWIGRLAVAGAVAGVTVLLVTVAWTNRAYRNLPALAVEGLRFSPEVVPASWLVPGVNLIVPKLVLDELWRGSSPEEVPGSTAWRKRPVPFLSHLGWGVLMAGATGAILADLGLAADTGSDVDGLRLVLLLGAASGIAIALGVVLLGVFVTNIGERQLERAAVLGPPEFVVVQGARWGRSTDADADDQVVAAPAADGTRPTPLPSPAMPRPGVVWGRY